MQLKHETTIFMGKHACADAAGLLLLEEGFRVLAGYACRHQVPHRGQVRAGNPLRRPAVNHRELQESRIGNTVQCAGWHVHGRCQRQCGSRCLGQLGREGLSCRCKREYRFPHPGQAAHRGNDGECREGID